MKWLALLVLWIVALVAALIVLRRVRRGRHVVLAGRWSPRFVRMVAIVLVVLGAGDSPKGEAAPKSVPIRPADDELPKALPVQTWLAAQNEAGHLARERKSLLLALTGHKVTDLELVEAKGHASVLGKKMEAILLADLRAIQDGKSTPNVADDDLKVALVEMEQRGLYDHVWNAYLWRKTATDVKDPAARIELYARVRQHARITDALIRAYSQVRPMIATPRAWMSKAGPRPEDRKAIQAYEASLNDFIKVAAEVLPTTDEGTWKRDGVVRLKAVGGTATLIRGGRERAMATDEPSRFGRLDLIRTGEKSVTLEHEWLGKFELPANAIVSSWDIAKYLPDAGRQKLDETVLTALKDNSEEAADRLERALPLAHAAIRAGLKELPKESGSSRLRLILSLFDDVAMPVLPNYQRGVGY